MRTSVKVLVGAALVLAGVRAALPAIIESRLNAKLARLDGWDASVGDVDLGVLRGRLVLRGLKADGRRSSLRAAVARTTVDLSWAPLLRGKIVASVEITRPQASMTLHRADKEKAKEAAEKTKEKAEVVWPELRDYLPFRIDRFAVRDGELTVKEGELEMKLTGLYLTVRGLTNMKKGARALGEAGATINKDGTARADFKIVPAARPPAFDVALSIKKVALAELNPLLLSEFGMDVEKGVFELVSEIESSGGGFRGYVKPFVEDLKMGPTGGRKKGPVKVVKEAVVGAVAAALKNRKSEAVAAKVIVEGQYDDPDIGVWQALASVLRNAFVEALKPSFETGG